LQVVAGGCFLPATTTTLLSRGPLLARQPVAVRLEPHDVFGNRVLSLQGPVECSLERTQLTGGALLASDEAQGGGGGGVAAVEHNGDGTYTLTLRAPWQGSWAVKPTIGGLRAGPPLALTVQAERSEAAPCALHVDGTSALRHVTQVTPPPPPPLP
jgi:hypothetical protein